MSDGPTNSRITLLSLKKTAVCTSFFSTPLQSQRSCCSTSCSWPAIGIQEILHSREATETRAESQDRKAPRILAIARKRPLLPLQRDATEDVKIFSSVTVGIQTSRPPPFLAFFSVPRLSSIHILPYRTISLASSQRPTGRGQWICY